MQTGARSSSVRGDGGVQEVQDIARRANLVAADVASVIDADTRHRAEEAVIARFLAAVPIPGPAR